MEHLIEGRIKQFFTNIGENISSVERKCGFSPNSLRASLDRGSAIGSDKLAAILVAYPDISAEWLFRGEGEMAKNTQTVGDITNSNVCGVNVRGSDVHFECPFDKEGFETLIGMAKNYQKSVEIFQHQINQLLSMIKK